MFLIINQSNSFALAIQKENQLTNPTCLAKQHPKEQQHPQHQTSSDNTSECARPFPTFWTTGPSTKGLTLFQNLQMQYPLLLSFICLKVSWKKNLHMVATVPVLIEAKWMAYGPACQTEVSRMLVFPLYFATGQHLLFSTRTQKHRANPENQTQTRNQCNANNARRNQTVKEWGFLDLSK